MLYSNLRAYEGGGIQHYCTKNKIGLYMKALSTNYKPVFIKLKNLI